MAIRSVPALRILLRSNAGRKLTRSLSHKTSKLHGTRAAASFSAPLIVIITFSWTNYFYNKRKYKEEIADYLRDPES